MPGASDPACDGADAASLAYARGGVTGLIDLVIRLHVRIARLERAMALSRDTVPCAAPEEGGP